MANRILITSNSMGLGKEKDQDFFQGDSKTKPATAHAAKRRARFGNLRHFTVSRQTP